MNKEQIDIKAINTDTQREVIDHGSFLTLDEDSICLVYNFEYITDDERMGLPVERKAMAVYKNKRSSVKGISFRVLPDDKWEIVVYMDCSDDYVILFNKDKENEACALYGRLHKYIFGE